jgi:hypothetical protein
MPQDAVIHDKLLAVLNQLVELDTHMLFVEPVQVGWPLPVPRRRVSCRSLDQRLMIVS